MELDQSAWAEPDQYRVHFLLAWSGRGDVLLRRLQVVVAALEAMSVAKVTVGPSGSYGSEAWVVNVQTRTLTYILSFQHILFQWDGCPPKVVHRQLSLKPQMAQGLLSERPSWERIAEMQDELQRKEASFQKQKGIYKKKAQDNQVAKEKVGEV
ncbi:hypothetical protein TREES_T100015523 [Tupaia chinensis]|uniref:Uncharacterized protein n=1 Tax=Tupaia chinensis TaxID=246437 RepID=L9LEU0_TUPCH|nr:hypothetical protein TREES_T100015523 [Tupaia chinensis]